MRCGSVTVPLDRQNPAAGTIDIHYALVPHSDTSRPSAGTIVPNPGGPGQATIGSAGLYLQALAPLLRDRDLLLIDARGTGQSGALSCPSLSSRDRGLTSVGDRKHTAGKIRVDRVGGTGPGRSREHDRLLVRRRVAGSKHAGNARAAVLVDDYRA
jgi:pimeloyl-ACP methyl ester carboxylesterase